MLRDRFRVPPAEMSVLERQLREHTVVPRPAAPSALKVRDPDDAWVLAAAIDGGADILVTGDKDLLTIAEDAPLPILDPRGCWERLRGRSA